MPDSKNLRWLEQYGQTEDKSSEALPADEPAANDADGWQRYRHWISKAPASRPKRSGIDPSLFSWRGYREWSEKVKRDWPEPDDND